MIPVDLEFHSAILLFFFISYFMSIKSKSSNIQMKIYQKDLKPNSVLLQQQHFHNEQENIQLNNRQILESTTYNGQEKYLCASCLNCCGRSLIWLRFCFPCICCCTNSPFYHQNSYSFGILQNFGRYVKILKPGFNVINPLTQRVIEISKQTKILKINQFVITKDNINLEILSTVYYRVVDPIKLAYKLGNIQITQSVQQLTFATVRTICGQYIFQDLLQKRQTINRNMKSFINQQIRVWGIYIQQIFLKDLILSAQLQQDLSMVTKVNRLQQSSLINTQAMAQASLFYAQAAQRLSTKAAYQIRYLNLINEVSQSNNERIMMINLDEKY